MPSQQFKTRRMVLIGLFAAISIILYFLEIPFFSAYLKIDFSDLPAALAAILFGPLAGILIELIKNIIFFIVRDAGQTMGYGALINFIVGVALILPLSIISRLLLHHGKTLFLALLIGGIAGLASMVVVGIVANSIIAPPYFYYVLHVPLTGKLLSAAVLSATILNVAKSIITAVILGPLLTAMRRNSRMLHGLG